MSSCAASCCICFPKASFAFATLASSPTGGAPLSSRSVFNYSEQYSHRRPNQKPPLPRNRTHFGSVPNVAERWWSSRDLPLPNSNSVLHPFSPKPTHERQIQAPSVGALRHLPECCALLPPNKPLRFRSPLKVLLLPPANYHQANPLCPLVRSTTSPRCLSHQAD